MPQRTRPWFPGGAPIIVLTALAVFLSGCRFESVEEENLEISIEAMLDGYAAEWNAGNVDGLMRFYAEGTSTSFMTATGPVLGRADIRAELARQFASHAVRGELRFEDVRVRPLPPLIGIVTGRYSLDDGDGTPGTGWFTFAVRRAGEGWRIVHDHAALESEWN